MLRRLRRQFLRIVPDPIDVRDNAPMVVPFLVVVIMNVIGAKAAHSLVVASGQPALGIDLLFGLLTFLSPLIVLIKALAAATVTWAVLTLLSARARLRTLLSIHMYCAMPLALPPIMLALFSRPDGSGFPAPQDLRVPLGSDLLLGHGLSPAALILAQQVTMFHVTWACLLCWLLCRSLEVPGRIAVSVAVALWGLGTAFAVLRAVVLP